MGTCDGKGTRVILKLYWGLGWNLEGRSLRSVLDAIGSSRQFELLEKVSRPTTFHDFVAFFFFFERTLWLSQIFSPLFLARVFY